MKTPMFKRIALFFQHYFHPMHVWCRLLDVGIMGKSTATKLCSYYEVSIYDKLIQKCASIRKDFNLY